MCREAEERAAGQWHTAGERQAINAVRDGLSEADNRALDWQDYLAKRAQRRQIFINAYRRDCEAAAQAVREAEAAVRYFAGKVAGKAEAERRLAFARAEYDQVAAALKDSERVLAELLAEPRQKLAAPVKLLGRPR